MRSNAQNLQVLYEDNHIIAVNKRSSDIVQGDKTGDQPLSDVVKEWLRIKYNKPGNVFTGVVHRIDRPVSGVVVFAKTSKALSRLVNQFRERDVQKTYWAAVCKSPQEISGRLVDHLLKDGGKNKSFVRSSNSPKAKEATLDYEIIGRTDKYTILEVKPITGRHHQIRVQLSHMGCPIKGDLKYGAPRSNPDGGIHLHARAISFVHPVKKELIYIEAPLPEDPVWMAFGQ